MPERVDRSTAFVHAVVTEIQVAAGAAPYATTDELVDIFARVVDRVPEPASPVDLMILRRVFARATHHIYRHAGTGAPIRPIVNLVADADDPRAEFRKALFALRDPERVRQ